MTRTRHFQSFLRSDNGGSTVFALSLVVGSMMMAGLALDVSYAYKSRNELQMAADAAAHAALYKRQFNSAAAAKSAAVDVANGVLPPTSYGKTLQPGDIVFGNWDFAAQTFIPDPSSTEGVMVSTKRFDSGGNAVPTFMLNFIGVEQFDVRADAVFVTHYPACLNQGFTAQDTVDLKSNNTYYSGFCIHSNDEVKMKQENNFEAGVVVSMPDSTDADGHTTSNTGLADALEDHEYRLRILDNLDQIVKNLLSGGSFVPGYITLPTPVTVTAESILGMNPSGYKFDGDSAILQTGRVYILQCDDGDRITIEMGVVLKDVVIVTACKLKFEAGAAVENAVLVTTNTNSDSISAPAGFRVGVDDNCAPGGGVQIITYGGIKVPADFQVFGGQIIAKRDVEFAAQAGIHGVAIIAGGKIDGTSNSEFRFCKGGVGMENSFALPYFRLAG